MPSAKMTETITSQREPGREQRVNMVKITQSVWLVFGIIEALIALRIGLKLIGANPASPIAVFIYDFTGLFLLPFTGLTGTPAMGSMVLEISSLIAIFVYALIAWGLVKLIWVIFYRSRTTLVDVTQSTTTDLEHPGQSVS